jgi:uncharacterized protein YbjT (DUF2867 family)
MHVLVTGATGLIGAAVVARLLQDGHEVTGIARHVASAARRSPHIRWIAFDMAHAASVGLWHPFLDGVGGVVNCAGALQDGAADSLSGVHERGLGLLIAACENAGVRSFIHFSAIGIDRETPTRFSRTKRAGEEALMRSRLDWIILRPSVVAGRAAYGGSALVRGLAALPVLPVMPGTEPLQIVQLDDVADTVALCLKPETPVPIALDLAGPERLTLTEVVHCYRRWLGWPVAREVHVPLPLAAFLFRLGDFAGFLGWRPPMRSTARLEIARGAVGDPSEWTRVTGITPRSLAGSLAREPASVQERWFAALYFMKAALFTVLPLFWIATGLISIGPGYDAGIALMREGGAGALSAPIVLAGGAADILIGLAIAFRRTSRAGLYAALAITLFYLAAGTLLLPGLWADPLGPLLKAVPIMVLNLIAIAILEDR